MSTKRELEEKRKEALEEKREAAEERREAREEAAEAKVHQMQSDAAEARERTEPGEKTKPVKKEPVKRTAGESLELLAKEFRKAADARTALSALVAEIAKDHPDDASVQHFCHNYLVTGDVAAVCLEIEAKLP